MNKGILLVEDNDAHAYLIEYFLREIPLVNHVDRAHDGEEALTYLFQEEASKLPALVLLDLHLPRISGLEVLRRMRTTPALLDVPVLILSTSDAETDAAEAYALRANGYLVKPNDASVFFEMLAATVRYWLRWNRDSNLRVAVPGPWSRRLAVAHSNVKA